MRRKCSCDGKCESCRKKRLAAQTKLTISRPGDRLEREADRVAEYVMSSAQTGATAGASARLVSRVGPGELQRLSLVGRQNEEEEEEEVQAKAAASSRSETATVSSSRLDGLGGGQPLPAGSRQMFESRFGVDFGRVRVHTDAEAARTARDLDARAFTVGRDVVFGAGQFAPESSRGQRLIAHELTHVIQQSGTDSGLVQREENGESELEPSTTPVTPATPMAPAPAVKICDPSTKLKLTDFAGTPPTSPFAAETKWTFPKVSGSSPTKYKALFSSSTSWMKDPWKKPTDRTATGCKAPVDKCTAFLTKNPTGTWTTPKGTKDPNCAASPVMNATTSKSVGECNTVLGAECDRVRTVESARLLAHEQLHFDIACVLVKKANASIAGGKTASTVKADLDKKSASTTTKYDNDTNHGCKAADQKAWATKVANSLPTVTVG